MKYQYTVKGVDYEVEIQDIEGNIANVTVNGIPFEVEMKQPVKAGKQKVKLSEERRVKSEESNSSIAQDSISKTQGEKQENSSLFTPHSSLPELEALLKAVNKANVKPYDFHPVGETFSTLTDEEHKENICKCIQHCLRGDVFQIVVSRRFIQKYEGDDFKLYRALRSINPSPYLFYFDFGGFRIFGSSLSLIHI